MRNIEEIPHFSRLDLTMLWRSGSDLVERCLAQGHPVTVGATIGRQRVFHAALPGTSADNDFWVERKLRTVARFGVPTLSLDKQFGQSAQDFFRDFGLDPALYTTAGGAVPLLVADVVVGGLAVSGLASADDHRLAVSALQHLHETTSVSTG